MKKIIIFLFFIFVFISNAKALENTFYLGEKVNDMYIESIGYNDMHNGAPFILHRNDGKIVYCLNPFYMMNVSGKYQLYSYNDKIFNLSNEQLNKMNIISYYGYGYKNHTDIKWYGITQFLIWKTLDLKDIYFTDTYYGSRIEKYVSEVNELENLVNKYYQLPSFNGNKYEYNPNTNYIISDTNNVLNNYEIYESNIDAYISENKLYVNTKKSGNYVIKFKRSSPVSNGYLLYYLQGSQSLLYPGKINDITFSINIEVNSGSITINKKDSENKSRLEATLDGAVYGIYKDNKLIQKITTGKNGNAHISDLTLGTYVIKELESSKGYNIDKKEYTVKLTKENKDIIIDSVSNVIIGNLIINKYYGESNNYKIDESAIFEVYYKDKLLSTLNNTNKNLEYGTYTIKQTNGKKYYDLVNDFEVSILENKDYKYDLYTEKTDEIKAYEDLLNKREEQLNKKEEELDSIQKELNDLKEEINNKYYELDDKKEEIKKLEENLINNEKELINLKEELNKKEDEIKNKLEELKTNDENNKKIEEELKQLKEELTEKEKKLENKEKNIEEIKKELDDKYKELNKFESTLLEKEKYLNEFEQNIKDKENVLVVEVPNTYKKDEKNYLSLLFIFIGVSFILLYLNIKRKLHV